MPNETDWPAKHKEFSIFFAGRSELDKEMPFFFPCPRFPHCRLLI